MTRAQLETPVVLLVFNRPDHTEKVFAAVRAVRPTRLLVVADGPRSDRPDEPDKCERVRQIVTSIDWDCEVSTNFSDANLGCAERVISGLTWAFDAVDAAIILEDDCLPGNDFFRFCEELIPRYKDDSRVGLITGNNFGGPSPRPYSYHFSQITHVWGWASWRSSWQRYDRTLEAWPAVKAGNFLSEVYTDNLMVEFWCKTFEMMHQQKERQITWDYQWCYTNLVNNCLTIMPTQNLVTNIGFGPEATHTKTRPAGFPLPEVGRIEFPLQHPPCFVPMRSLDRKALQSILFPEATLEFGQKTPEQDEPANLEIGTSPIRYGSVTGMYDVEMWEGRPLRWTDGHARIPVILRGPAYPKSLDVKLWNLLHSETPLRITVNDVSIFDGPLPADGLYESLALPALDGQREAVFKLESATFQLQGAGRRLGIAVESLLVSAMSSLDRKALQSTLFPETTLEFGQKTPERDEPVCLEIGTSPIRYGSITGMYEIEMWEGRPLRWTDGHARIPVIIRGPAYPKSLDVKLWNLLHSETSLRITVNDVSIFDGPLPADGLYESLALPALEGAREAVFKLESATIQSQGEHRRLGVAVESLLLSP